MPTSPETRRRGGLAAGRRTAAEAAAFYAPLLRRVFRWHRRGLSLRQIAAALRRRGIRTRLGRSAGQQCR